MMYTALLAAGYVRLPKHMHNSVWHKIVHPYCVQPSDAVELVMQPYWAINIAEALPYMRQQQETLRAQEVTRCVLAWCFEDHPRRAKAALMVYASGGDVGLVAPFDSAVTRNGDPHGAHALKLWLTAQGAVLEYEW